LEPQTWGCFWAHSIHNFQVEFGDDTYPKKIARFLPVLNGYDVFESVFLSKRPGRNSASKEGVEFSFSCFSRLEGATMMESRHVTKLRIFQAHNATPSTLPHSLVVKVYCSDNDVAVDLSFILQTTQ